MQPRSNADLVVSQTGILWNGGPPPDDSLWGWVTPFVADIFDMHSLTGAMKKHHVSADAWETLLDSSPWVREQVDRLMKIKKKDVELATIHAAIGHTETDADGNVIRRGRDPVAAKYLLEREERASGIPVGVGAQMPPQVEDKLSQIRRENGLTAVSPWMSAVDGGRVIEVGKLTAQQMNIMKARGAVFPDVPRQWFVRYELSDGDWHWTEVRDVDYNLLPFDTNPALTLKDASHAE